MTNNYTHTSNFIFINPLLNENTHYYLQKLNLPSVSLPNISTPKRSINAFTMGDTLEFSDITLSFIIDEQYKVVKDLYNLLFNMVNPNEDKRDLISEYARLIVKDENSKNNVLTIEFKDMLLTSISDIEYVTIDEDEVITIDATFNYDYFTIL